MSEKLFRGHYEDLIQLIIRLEERNLARAKHVLPVKPAWQRAVLELPLNLVSSSISLVLRLLPPKAAHSFFLWTYDGITKNKYQSLGKQIAENSNSASAIYSFITSKYSEPALITLTSHPPVVGRICDLNVGLMGTGYRLMHAIRGSGRRFRIVAAIDQMALDTLAVAEEAMYAGAVGYYQISTDRLPSSRGPLQKFLMRRTAFDSAAWRLIDGLKERHNIVMVHAGGVGETARLIYTTRELVWRLRQDTRKKPWEILQELSDSSPQFKRFLSNFSEGGNVWKRIEAFLICLLARDPLVQEVSQTTLPPSNTGKLEPRDGQIIRQVIQAFGLDWGPTEALVKDFTEEFSRITPFRRRLFRIIIQRVLAKGVPILLLPLDWKDDPHQPILPREPIALLPRPDGGVDAASFQKGAVQLQSVSGPEFFRGWSLATYAS